MTRQSPGPSAIRRAAILAVVRQAARCPRRVAQQLVGGVGVAAGVFEPWRVASAYAWATAHGQRGIRRWRTTFRILEYRGQRLLEHWAPTVESPAALRQRVVLEGRARLDAATGRPTILLGFHLGSSLTRWGLAVHGYDCLLAGDGGWSFRRHATPHAGWREVPETAAVVAPGAGPVERSIVLYRLRALLLAGGTVRLLGDGADGRELFRVPLARGSLVVRAGWWLLRRQTQAVTLPVLAHQEGPSVVVTVHQALPPAIGDPEADLARCRALLEPLVQNFVRSHPEQCLPWIFDTSSAPDPHPAGDGPPPRPRTRTGASSSGASPS
jgi:hypothetical protein